MREKPRHASWQSLGGGGISLVLAAVWVVLAVIRWRVYAIGVGTTGELVLAVVSSLVAAFFAVSWIRARRTPEAPDEISTSRHGRH